jgi:hypothetical protein
MIDHVRIIYKDHKPVGTVQNNFDKSNSLSKGKASDKLLSSFCPERRPAAQKRGGRTEGAQGRNAIYRYSAAKVSISLAGSAVKHSLPSES